MPSFPKSEKEEVVRLMLSGDIPVNLEIVELELETAMERYRQRQLTLRKEFKELLEMTESEERRESYKQAMERFMVPENSSELIDSAFSYEVMTSVAYELSLQFEDPEEVNFYEALRELRKIEIHTNAKILLPQLTDEYIKQSIRSLIFHQLTQRTMKTGGYNFIVDIDEAIANEELEDKKTDLYGTLVRLLFYKNNRGDFSNH